MRRRLRATALAEVFDAIRTRAELPTRFPPEAMEEAHSTAGSPRLGDRADLRHIPFVTVDPAGSLDLDQAIAFEARPEGGTRLRYAIADVAAFVDPGGALDGAVVGRGTTVYCPDRRIPLHPTVLSEGEASLLPGQDRPAIVWEIDVDASGEPTRSDVRRALVRSAARFTYAELQARVDRGDPPEPLADLEWFGDTRIARGVERGALTLRLPEQEVASHDGGWRIVTDAELPTERWNAEVSLLTGMTAASMMRSAGTGVLRTLPPADPGTLGELRAAARGLGIAWSADRSAAEVLAGLDPSRPRQLALFDEATRLLRGASYQAFVDGSPRGDTGHAGLAAEYAHVTAPIRRLVDRYALETCVSIAADRPVPGWVTDRLPTLPDVMAETTNRAGSVEQDCLDAVEAWVMSHRVGEAFDAVVLESRSDGVELWLDEPAVLTWAYGMRARAGDTVRVRVAGTDVEAGRIDLEET